MASIPISSVMLGAGTARLRALLTQKPTGSVHWVRVLALEGLALAQLCYGRMLLEGTGTPKDLEEARRWFERAAHQGDIDAINMVGRCFDMGWGAPEDPVAAARYYFYAAEADHAWAQYNLGHLLLNGRGVVRDHQRAYGYYLRAARQGHARAMNLVGRCCERGWGTPRDPNQAASWYQRSAAGHYFRGQYNWATVLLERGRLEEALRWFRRAAASGTSAVRAAASSAIERILAESAPQ
ncbi:MAG TPA: tetratricopeptide repeat protein [Steroidobacteraceae bacterium]|jgi:hypothetical protein